MTDIYVAIESGSAEVEGKPFIFIRGVTRIRYGHPALRQIGQFFKPVEENVHYDVERATAAPGEKREAAVVPAVVPEPIPEPEPTPEPTVGLKVKGSPFDGKRR
jgi:hypothetical protein